MARETLSERFLRENAAVFEAMVSHRFTTDIERGLLPAEAFDRYLVYEGAFVDTAISIFALATAKAGTIKQKRWLIGVLDALANRQVAYFERTFAQRGIKPERFDLAEPRVEAFRAGMDLYFQRHDGEAATIEDFLKVFEDASAPGKGRFYACPPGWGCEIITNNLIKALGLDATYEIYPTGSGANLKATIARQVSRKKPFIGWYWGPTEVISKYKLKVLDMPAYDAAKFTCLTDAKCEKPELTGWAVGEVAVAATTKLKDKSPAVADFLAKMQVPNAEISDVLAWGDDNKASPEEVAKHFLKDYEAIWTKWVPADVAEKVKASL